MKEINEITNQIVLDEFLSKHKTYQKMYSKFNTLKSMEGYFPFLIHAKLYHEYSIHFKYIEKLYNKLTRTLLNENSFKELEKEFIIFRNFIFLFRYFYKLDDSECKTSIFKSLTPNTLNFKYLDLNEIKDKIEKFRFTIYGVTPGTKYLITYKGSQHVFAVSFTDEYNIFNIEAGLKNVNLFNISDKLCIPTDNDILAN